MRRRFESRALSSSPVKLDPSGHDIGCVVSPVAAGGRLEACELVPRGSSDLWLCQVSSVVRGPEIFGRVS